MKAGMYLQLIVTVKVESAKLHEVVEHWSYLQYRFVYHYVLCLIYCQQYTVYERFSQLVNFGVHAVFLECFQYLSRGNVLY